MAKNNEKKTFLEWLKGFFLPYRWKGKAREHYVQYIPLVILLGYYPLVMRTTTFNSGLSRFDWFADANEVMVDIFLLPKSRALYVIALLMLVFMGYWVWTQRGRFKAVSRRFILIAVAAGLAVVAAIATPYHDIVLNGSFENFETIFVTLIYMLVMLYAYLVFSWTDDPVRDFTWLYRMACPGYIALIGIGFFQAIGHDPFQTDLGKTFFATEEYWSNLDLITISDGVYMTLHNIDYVPIYLGMCIPLLLVLLSLAETLGERIFRALLLLLTLFDFVSVAAEGGKLGFLAAVVVAVFLLVHRNKKVLFGCIGIGVAGIALLLILPQTRNYIMAGIGAKNTHEPARITELETLDDEVEFVLDGEELHLSYAYDNEGNLSVSLKDGEGTEIEGTYYPTDGTYFPYYEYPGVGEAGLIASQSNDSADQRALLIGTSDGQLAFLINNEVDDTGSYYYQNFVGKYIKMPVAFSEAHIFPDGLFSARGQIWNKTLPILKDYMLIGAGSGLFITAYPQWDYLEKAFQSSTYDVKPHDVYLQWWVEEGFIFLVCLLAFIGIYVAGAGKYLWEFDGGNEQHRLALAVLTSVCTYLVSGLFNDSMIVYSPLFWTVLGLGCALNYRKNAA